MMRGLWLSALALALAAPVAAQDAPTWRPVDAETGKISDLAGLEQLTEDFPDSGSVRLRLLNAQLGAGDAQAVLASLAWLKERGYVFSEGAQKQIPELLGEAYAEEARALFIQQVEVIEASEVVATVPAEAGLVESVQSSNGRRDFIVSSITRNGLYFSTAEGRWVPWYMGSNDWSGTALSPDKRIIWFASSNIDGSEDEGEPFNGLVGWTGKIEGIRTFPAPEGATLSDLAAGPDGSVYASDPLAGGLYRLQGGKGTVEVLVPPGTFRSPQGLTLSGDGNTLYVSDYRYGLAMVDLGSGVVLRLPSSEPILLDGIDGLWRHGSELIAVQNGSSPMRIIALQLSGDGRSIIGQRLLEQAHPEWTEPLGGSIAGDALVYVATGQWDRYDKGKLKEGKEAIPTEIRRLPLNP